MCGIGFISGSLKAAEALAQMAAVMHHRGPDDNGIVMVAELPAGISHTRLSIIDLSEAGHQPMTSMDGRYTIAFNGEIYNYIELRAELPDYPYRSRTDTEVILAAYQRWGRACLHRFIGMFAFVLWDAKEEKLWAARDRFGVKPFYYHLDKEGSLRIASEIKAIRASGVRLKPDPTTWATYLSRGLYDHSERTFWEDVRSLPPGGEMTWSRAEGVKIRGWYDLANVAGGEKDTRDDDAVADELLALLEESVRLRFRSDVPVGVCLSGGLDSSLLLGLIHRIQGHDSEVEAFSFHCGDPLYDETPWIEAMLRATRHPWSLSLLEPERIPTLAAAVQLYQDEPYGGLPTLGMACVHERARERGVTVLLDGNGIDEAWGGYDYYGHPREVDADSGPVQGSMNSRASLEGAMRTEFAALAMPWAVPRPGNDPLFNLQYRDIRYAKIPRALRFNDRVSMMFSRELREPFLDHRIVELGLRQPTHRKIRNGQGKWLVRELARRIIPASVSSAPKRPVQTPQREWLRRPLSVWAQGRVEAALGGWGRDWLDPDATLGIVAHFVREGGDNSFPFWQLINLGLAVEAASESGS